MRTFYEIATDLFDPLHSFWERPRTKRLVAVTQVLAFLVGVIGIQCNRWGLLPPFIARITPTSHFYAINLAFTLVLIQEVIDLIFVLPCSVTKSVGKQFEVLCLILLRNSFKELVHFTEPITLPGSLEPVLPMLADGAGALLIFVGLGFYYRFHLKRPAGKKGPWLYPFVALKKFLAWLLLLFFLIYGGVVIYTSARDGVPHHFFDVFYTVLIFSDILVVLISHSYQPAFKSVFRNSGFALTTLLIRFALAAPPFYAPLLGVLAVGLAFGLTAAHDAFTAES